MSEEDAFEKAIYVINNLKAQSRTPTRADFAEIKKWLRIAILFPEGVHRYLPKYKKFCERYHYMVYTLDFNALMKLEQEVLAELDVEPVNDKDFEFVAKGVIETISRKQDEEKEI